MVDKDRVARVGQWMVTAGSDGSTKPEWVWLQLLRSPATIGFRLNPNDALSLVQVLESITNHQTTEGTAGYLKVAVTNDDNEPGLRILKLEYIGSFPGECYSLLTDIAARQLADNLRPVAHRVIELNKG